MDKFIIAPMDVLLDKRLNHMQLKVLLALLSFRSKNTNLVWPKRNTIAELVGCSENNVSKVTKQLVNLGWLNKVGDGGLNKPTKYEVIVPDLEQTQSPSATQSPTATQSPSDTITQSPTDRRKEETNEEYKEKINKKENSEDSDLSLEKLFQFKPENLDEDLWITFIKIRKKRKATQTARAIKGQLRELALCEQAGITTTQAIEEFLEATWKGLKAQWIINARGNNADNRGVSKETASQRNARISQETTRQHQETVAKALADGSL